MADRIQANPTRFTCRMLCLLTLLATTAMAANNAPAPSKISTAEEKTVEGGASDGEKPLTAIIRQVRGQVQVRPDAKSKWVAAKTGMQLTQGAEFRTGLRSQVAFEIPPGEMIALDRLGVVKLIQAVRRKNKIKTDIGMPYGRAAYTVEAAGEEHESTMHMPGNTLAIRGTGAVMFAQRPFPPQVTMLYGTASFTTTHRGTVDVTGRQKRSTIPKAAPGEEQAARTAVAENQGGDTGGPDFLGDLSEPAVCGAGFPGFANLQGTSTANNNNPDPGTSALQNQSDNLNNHFGNTDTEGNLKIAFPGGSPGGTGGFSPNNTTVPTVPTGPTEPMEPPTVHGMLEIMLTWQGDLDLDLLWRTPNGFAISPSPNASPVAMPTSPDGGVAGEDHPGPNGMEYIVFHKSHPTGDHLGTVLAFDGQGSAGFNLQVKRHIYGHPQEILGNFNGTLDLEEVTEFTEVIYVPETPPIGTAEQMTDMAGRPADMTWR